LTAADRMMVNLPLFHVGGTGPLYQALVRGSSVVVVDAFDIARFWPLIRETGTTTVILLGVMASFVVKQPTQPGDRDHPLRSVMMVPLCEDAEMFSQRFGCDV